MSASSSSIQQNVFDFNVGGEKFSFSRSTLAAPHVQGSVLGMRIKEVGDSATAVFLDVAPDVFGKGCAPYIREGELPTAADLPTLRDQKNLMLAAKTLNLIALAQHVEDVFINQPYLITVKTQNTLVLDLEISFKVNVNTLVSDILNRIKEKYKWCRYRSQATGLLVSAEGLLPGCKSYIELKEEEQSVFWKNKSMTFQHVILSPDRTLGSYNIGPAAKILLAPNTFENVIEEGETPEDSARKLDQLINTRLKLENPPAGKVGALQDSPRVDFAVSSGYFARVRVCLPDGRTVWRNLSELSHSAPSFCNSFHSSRSINGDS